MTLTVVLQGKDGLVLSSDSRGTFGVPTGLTAQNDTIKKVFLVGHAGILTAGGQQGSMIIEDVAKAVEAEKIVNATDVMEKLRAVSRQSFNEWYAAFPFLPAPGQNQGFMRPTIQLTVAGYDIVNEKQVIPRIYSMVSNLDFAPNLHDFGFALGGVPNYALYLLNRLYNPDMGISSLKHLAAYVVTETATQDGRLVAPSKSGL